MHSEQPLVITGPAGALDARLQMGSKQQGLLMCHPHPLFAGSMDNKVVTTLTRAASAQGLTTLRFNFRGVGQSAGVHDNGQGEQVDVLACLHYLSQQLGIERIILAGFSFGAAMACLAACQEPERISKLILIAPPVHHFDAPSSLPFQFDTHILIGDADEVVPIDEVEHWAQTLTPSPEFVVFADAGHFFHGRLVALKETLLQILSQD